MAGPPEAGFVGHENDLLDLQDALARTDRDGLSIALVEGESGIGKTMLVSELIRRARARSPRLLVLRSRCHEHEQTPYQAFDGAIDELARSLARLSESEHAAILPRRAASTARIFPALGRIAAIARGAGREQAAEPVVQRLEAFQALGELLSRLSEDRPLILAIDDLQWADQDSFRLLRALVSLGPPIMLVATIRPAGELSPSVADQAQQLKTTTGARTIAVTHLSRSDATSLVRQLLGPRADTTRLRQIVADAQGHPMLLTELAHLSEPGEDARPSLDALLGRRIAALDAGARLLLQLVALSGRACPTAGLSQALSEDALAEATKALLAQRLVRRHSGQELACTHAAVRSAAEASIGPGALPALARLLTRSFEGTADARTGNLARHFDAANEGQHALKAYRQAAKHAVSVLAFARAETLLRRAVELALRHAPSEAAELRQAHAEVLINLGQSVEAAQIYGALAAEARGERSLRLRVRGAQLLLQSGRTRAGLSAAREVLSERGVPWKEGRFGQLWSLLLARIKLGLRDPATLEASHEASPEERSTLDALHQLSLPIAWVEPLRGSGLSAYHLAKASAWSDKKHMARALASEAAFLSIEKPDESTRAAALLRRSRELVPEGDHATFAHVSLMEGAAAMFQCEYGTAQRSFESALRILDEHCPDEHWARTHVRGNLTAVRTWRGQFREAMHDADQWIAAAREQGDLFAYAALLTSGSGFLRHLLIDAPDEALAELAMVTEQWPASELSFPLLGALYGQVLVGAYAGSDSGWSAIERIRVNHSRSFLLRTRTGNELFSAARANAALAALGRAVSEEQRGLRASAQSAAENLCSLNTPRARAFGVLNLSMLDALESRPESAIKRARESRVMFESLDCAVRYGALWLEGQLVGGAEGDGQREAALRFFEGQGFRDPLRAVAIHVPIAALLDDGQAAARKRRRVLGGHYMLDHSVERLEPGQVVAARDTRSDRKVELLPVARMNSELLAEFKAEFRVLSELRHASIARLLAMFLHEGQWVVVRQPIHGVGLLDFVRPGDQLDPGRTRRVFVELTRALDVLHRAGLVRRELRPRAMLVHPDGVPVLPHAGSPFLTGLLAGATRSEHDEQESDEERRAADLRALGAAMYEILTGMPPSGPQDLPSELDPRVPAELEAACLRLSAIRGYEPLVLEEVLTSLERSPPSRASLDGVSSATGHADEEIFCGRERELGTLANEVREARSGLRIALVEGDTGIGKSALVRELLRRTRAQQPGALTLRSRCFESELSAYKAFEGLYEELARELRARPSEEVWPLLPPRVAALAQLFPVLDSVPAIAQSSHKGLAAEPTERRAQAFAAARELWARLGRDRPVVLAIDDLQWADPGSFRLLRTLWEGPISPHVCIVATLRPVEERDAEAEADIEVLRTHARTTTIALVQLSGEDAEALTRRLLRNREIVSDLGALVHDSQGHPLFLRELVHEALRGELRDSTPSLERALRMRVVALHPEAALLLDALAIASRPCRENVLERLLEAEGQLRGSLDLLIERRLARHRGADEVVVFHDIVRRLVLRHMSPERRREVCGRLARALSLEPVQDSAELGRLWGLSGAVAEAVTAFIRAGEEALSGLAFDRAARLGSQAIALLEKVEDERALRAWTLYAQALARLGKSSEAASAFERAADLAQGGVRVNMRVLAAQQLLQSGEAEAGLNAARTLFGELGIRWPKSTWTKLASIAWSRASLLLSGMDVSPREQAEVSEHDRAVLDALHELSFPVMWVELLQGGVLNGIHLRKSLAVGDRKHAARCLSAESAFVAMQRIHDKARQEALFARARAIMPPHDPATEAYVMFMEASAAIFRCEYKPAEQRLTEALSLLDEHCPGEHWLRTNVRCNLTAARYAFGTYARAARESTPWIDSAREDGDRFATSALLTIGMGFAHQLLADQPALALSALEEGTSVWPARDPSFPHVGMLLGQSVIHSYRGSTAGWEWLERHKALFASSFLRRTRFGREAIASAHVVCGLAALPHLKDELAAHVRHGIDAANRELDALATPRAEAQAALARAQLLALEGRTEQGMQAAQAVLAIMEGRSDSWCATARFLLGHLEGGEHGKQQRADALRVLAMEGAQKPLAFASHIAPTLRALVGE